MAQTTQPDRLSADDMEALTMLVLRYLDGGCGADEIQNLKSAIVDRAGNRELFVQICRMQGNLYEAHAHRRAELLQKAALATVQANASAPVMQTAGRAGTTTRAQAATERHAGLVPEQPGRESNPAGQPAPTDVRSADPGAETIVTKLSGEDTIHPAPKDPKA